MYSSWVIIYKIIQNLAMRPATTVDILNINSCVSLKYLELDPGIKI